MAARVAWISLTPIKALGIVARDEVLLEPFGVRENRRFVLVDDDGRAVAGNRIPALRDAQADYDEATETLTVRLPDGEVLRQPLDPGPPTLVDLHRRRLRGRLVPGPAAEALSALAGRPLRLVRIEQPGDAVDRGRSAAVSLLSTASLDVLTAAAAAPERVDGRRFRMLFGVDGVEPYEEERWIGRRVRIGEAVVLPGGNVGRCAVTTYDPETGWRDLDTLRLLKDHRDGVRSSEPLPFGVWGEVVEPGRVRLGDPVVPL